MKPPALSVAPVGWMASIRKVAAGPQLKIAAGRNLILWTLEWAGLDHVAQQLPLSPIPLGRQRKVSFRLPVIDQRKVTVRLGLG